MLSKLDMKIFNDKHRLDLYLAKIRVKKVQIALIPTMGGIHQGHLSLVKEAIQKNFFSLVTIYVNPTQFNNNNDYLNYPRDKSKDIAKLKLLKCNAVYLPRSDEIYPNGLESIKKIDKFRDILCDIFRPGHFDGVTTVV